MFKYINVYIHDYDTYTVQMFLFSELKHQSMGRKEFPLTLPLAPMHTGLQPQPITNSIRKRGTIPEEVSSVCTKGQHTVTIIVT